MRNGTNIRRKVGSVEIQLQHGQPGMIPSVYFSAAYGWANATHIGGDWCTIADEGGRWQVPLIVQRMDNDVIDAATPYGYGGIYAADDLTDEEITSAWSSTRSLLLAQGITSVFLRFSPFLPEQTARLGLCEGLEIERISETIAVRLTTEDDMWATMKKRSRYTVRKAREHGFTGAVERADHGINTPGHPFRQLYDATMDRLEAAAHYYFGDAYYQRLSDSLPGELHVAMVKDQEQNVVAAALVMCDTDVVHYHLSGSNPEAARLGANNLLIWSIMEWGATNGFTSLHLGGGVKAGDNLFKFKESFGGDILPFSIGRSVIDQSRYDTLVIDRARSLGKEPEELRSSGFFPAYRAR